VLDILIDAKVQSKSILVQSSVTTCFIYKSNELPIALSFNGKMVENIISNTEQTSTKQKGSMQMFHYKLSW
jgi:hypothetical protein